MSDLCLAILTHLLAAAGGGVVTRSVVMRRLRVTERDGHLSIELAAPHEKEPG